MLTGFNRSVYSLRNRLFVGVIGAGECEAELAAEARALGRELAAAGAVVVCGGMGGVMRAVCQGAQEQGGLTIGITPGSERSQANEFVALAIATGFGEARNLIIIRTADILIAIGGSYGTLSEIGFALKMGKRVIGLKTWEIEGVEKAASVAEVLTRLKIKGG
ncbi:MAG: TIGR00725 family protein [candidate division WOR-3 bacterium]